MNNNISKSFASSDETTYSTLNATALSKGKDAFNSYLKNKSCREMFKSLFNVI